VARAYQGHADAALRLTGQAVGSARRLGDPLGLVFALFCDAWAATVAEAVTRVLDSATEQAALIGKHGFRQWGIAQPAPSHRRFRPRMLGAWLRPERRKR
jgi:hypothetical protein